MVSAVGSCSTVRYCGHVWINNVATEKCGKGVLAAAGATRPPGKEVEWDGAEQGGFMCVRFDKLTNETPALFEPRAKAYDNGKLKPILWLICVMAGNTRFCLRGLFFGLKPTIYYHPSACPPRRKHRGRIVEAKSNPLTRISLPRPRQPPPKTQLISGFGVGSGIDRREPIANLQSNF